MADKSHKQPDPGEPRIDRPAVAPPQPEHVADQPVDEADALDAGVKSPTTETGLAVEEQVRKEWDPKKNGGLPTSLPAGRR